MKQVSYTALYRKFRPNRFSEVTGQDVIITTLKNQIKMNRIGHAYLFFGTRGTGKTTVAKILAKAVNCEQPIEGNPCGTCAMCMAIQNQVSMNVIEIDAASNNGVDHMREIIEEVQYSPTEGKYKVYIIDEVHMLSTGAFNALLKTLEEPPEYVIFILATTEPHKIPVTIVSRCQRYDFKRISVQEITGRLQQLMQQEKIVVEEKALSYIAKMADGSMRDALSLLDRCIAFYPEDGLDYEKTLAILGTVDVEVFFHLLDACIQQDVTSAMRQVEQLLLDGKELGQFVTDFIWYLRNMLLLVTTKEAKQLVEFSSEQLALLEEQVKHLTPECLMRDIRILSDLSSQMKYATQKRVLFEIALMKIMRPQMEQQTDAILARLEKLEQQCQTGMIQPVRQNPVQQVEQKEVQKKPPKEFPKAIPKDLQLVAKNWNAIIQRMPGVIKPMLAQAIPSVEGDALLLVFQEEVDRLFIEQKHLPVIEQIVQEQIKKKITIKTRLIERTEDGVEQVADLTKLIHAKIEYEE